MYENMTYERILKRMLDRVPDDLDKREGSVVYNAIAPAAVELQNLYIELDWMIDQFFADTAVREYLVRRAAERGIKPKAATKAVLKAVFNKDVAIGSRFSLGQLNYRAMEKISDGVFRMECETYGTEGNRYLGTMIPIEYQPGLSHAELAEVLIPGEDEEETEHLRDRYFQSLNSQAFGGNIADYKEKVNGLPGVGGVKVFPAWNGGGTVRLVIINSDYETPSSELVAEVQGAIDPVDHSGEGWGLAPIGHRVTVDGVKPLPVDIKATIEYQAGWIWADVETNVKKKIDEYFRSLGEEWAESKSLIVRVSRIEMLLLDTAGVVDVTQVLINGEDKNLALEENKIPERGNVSG